MSFFYFLSILFFILWPQGLCTWIPGVLIKSTQTQKIKDHILLAYSICSIEGPPFCIVIFFSSYKQKLKAVCVQMAHPAINMWHLAFFMIARCSLVVFLCRFFAYHHFRSAIWSFLALYEICVWITKVNPLLFWRDKHNLPFHVSMTGFDSVSFFTFMETSYPSIYHR